MGKLLCSHNKGKDKGGPVHVMKACRGSIGIASPILKRVTPRPLCYQYPWTGGWAGHRDCLDVLEMKKKNFLPLSKFEPRIIQPISLGPIPTTLAQLQCQHNMTHKYICACVWRGWVGRFCAVHNAYATCLKYSQFRIYHRSVCHLIDFPVWMPQACSGCEVAHWTRNFSESWCKWNLYVDTVLFVKETFSSICAAWHSTHCHRTKH